MPENSKKIYDKEMITQLRDVEKSIVESTLTDEEKQFAQEAEKSSVRFLEGYVKGEIDLADDAYDIMVNYLDYLSKSESPEIAQKLGAAQNIYMNARYARKKQKHQQEIVQSVGTIDIETLRKNNFSILDNAKKREALTSAHLIEMKEIMRNDKENNMSKRLQVLESYAVNRINDVLFHGKEKDEDFDKLVQIFGTERQKAVFRKHQPKPQPEITPVITTRNDPPVVTEEPPVVAPTKEVKPQAQKKSFREINKEKRQRKTKNDKIATYPTAEQFTILQDKKRAQQLSATELLELSNMLERVKKAPKKHQFKTDKIENTLRSYAQNLIVKIRKGNEISSDEAVKLASRYAPQQREAVQKQKTSPNNDRIIILPPIDNQDDDTKKQPIPKKEDDHTDKKPKKNIIKKAPWYKRTWNVIKKPVVALAAVIVIAASSFAIKGALGGENKTSDKDDAKKPLTEQTTKTNTEQQTENKAKTADFTEVQQELHKAQEKVQEVSQNKQNTDKGEKVSDDAEKYNIRVNTFLKTLTKYNKTVKEDPVLAEQNLKDAKDKLDKFVDSIKDKLPEGVSAERMAYLASFYRLFPNSEFGTKMKKMFNGEEISISKEEIAKLSKAHGDLGKNYVNSLQVSKANTGR